MASSKIGNNAIRQDIYPVSLDLSVLSERRSEIYHQAHEQTQFSAEDEKVERPAKIPQDAWKILQKDSLVQDTLSYENLPTEQLP